MGATRIQLWDFQSLANDNPPKTLQELLNQELKETKELQKFSQGELLGDISKKVDECIKINFLNTVKDIKRSASVFALHNEFFLYEMTKNSFDANAMNTYAFIYEKKINVTTTYVDDGTGLINVAKNINYFTTTLYYVSKLLPETPVPFTPYFFADSDNCLNYLKIVDPDFDTTQPESETNILSTEKKITSEKEISLTQEKKHAGGKGEGLKRIALFAQSVGGSFLMMDVNDLKKSEKYLEMTGIQDTKLLPETGAVFILDLPKYSHDFHKKFQPQLKNRISKKTTMENNYFLKLNPNAKKKLNRWRPQLRIKMMPIPDGEITLSATSSASGSPTSSHSSAATSRSNSPTSLSGFTSTSRCISSFSTPSSAATSRSNSPTAPPRSVSFIPTLPSFSSPSSTATSRSTSSVPSPTSRSSFVDSFSSPSSTATSRLNSSTSSPVPSPKSSSSSMVSFSSLSTPTPSSIFSPTFSEESLQSPEGNISINVDTVPASQRGFFASEPSPRIGSLLCIDVSTPAAPISPGQLSPDSDSSSPNEQGEKSAFSPK